MIIYYANEFRGEFSEMFHLKMQTIHS